MMGNIQAIEVQIPHEVVQYWGWFLVFGIGLLALGIAAVVRSVLATVATMFFFGWLLVLASGIEIAQAVLVGHWAGFFHHLLAAILFGVVGLMLVTRPVISAEALTIFMALFFLIGGLFQLIASIERRTVARTSPSHAAIAWSVAISSAILARPTRMAVQYCT
jgi:uncharacterized membrane protein HdeD (DUF308 family)